MFVCTYLCTVIVVCLCVSMSRVAVVIMCLHFCKLIVSKIVCLCVVCIYLCIVLVVCLCVCLFVILSVFFFTILFIKILLYCI